MGNVTDLTVFEQQMLLGIMRLHPNAYGVSIRDEIKSRTGKEYSFGSIYAVLERLEDRGVIVSREGDATAARGGRKKLYFTITGTGQKTLQASLNAMDAMRAGLSTTTLPVATRGIGAKAADTKLMGAFA
jgi:PadR family transcriptional regulator, regulatory protein PadR